MSRHVSDLPPGPPTMPLFGSHGNTLRYFRDPVRYLRMLHLTNGPIAAFVQGDTHWLFAFGPDYNHCLLSHPDIFYSNLAFLPSPPDSALCRLTAGLLSMNGEQHQRHRRLMLSLFHKKQVEGYHDDIVAVTQRFLDRWRVGAQLDVAYAMRQLTLQIVSTVLLGLHPDRDLRSVVATMQHWTAAFSSVGVHLLPKDWPGTAYRHLHRTSDQLETLLRAIIAEKRTTTTTQRDLLAQLIQMHDEDGAQLTDEELIGHTNLLFIAGHETSANALAWTLFLLAQHPTILHDLLDELNGVLGGRVPTVEELNQLPLLERVIKESLRILPPAAYAERMGSQPFTLGPYALPKGSYVGFSSLLTHHMPELYPEPERFLPQRWLTITPSPYEYLPFGAGPRMCLGAAFAMQEIKIVLALLLQRYHLASLRQTTVDYHMRITLAPKRLMMIVSPTTEQRRLTPIRGNIRSLVALP